MYQLDQRARDIAIRTILGEAANESPLGQAAVAHVLLNRARDSRWPSSVDAVALQPKQFSAWNSGAGGNDLVNRYGPESAPYQRAGGVLDAVLAGQMPDPTGGATHYYSPAGMRALVNEGSQENILPRWLQQEAARRNGNNVTIGGHIFTGLADGSAPQPTMTAETQAPQGVPEGVFGQASEDSLLGRIAMASDQGAFDMLMAPTNPAPAPPQIAPRQAAPIQTRRRDTISPYLELFKSLG